MSDVSRFLKAAAAAVAAFSAAVFFAGQAFAGYDSESSGMMGVPVNFGASSGTDLSACPQGARVIEMFLAAWDKGDYKTMYLLIDDASKEGYPYEEARFDLQFMDHKDYSISSVRKTGDNFEFILSSGDWKDGDKTIKKMLVSGRSFKIIMPSRGSFFKDSAENNL